MYIFLILNRTPVNDDTNANENLSFKIAKKLKKWLFYIDQSVPKLHLHTNEN